MSYTPNTWQDGDTITAAKLNNMEGGIENANTPFVVTCTPTAEDFSGVMDKTVSEMYEAYLAGRRILFKIMESETSWIMVECTVQYFTDAQYPSFNAYFVTDSPFNAIVYLYTGTTDNGERDDYGIVIYPLTPMNG